MTGVKVSCMLQDDRKTGIEMLQGRTLLIVVCDWIRDF